MAFLGNMKQELRTKDITVQWLDQDYAWYNIMYFILLSDYAAK